MDFSVEVEHQDGVSIVKVYGDVDLYTAPRLDSCLQHLLASSNTLVAIDLENCTYFDSEGIKAVIRAMRSGDGNGQRMALCGAQGPVSRVFEIAGLGMVLGIFPSVDALSRS
jgi:anti-sigma B factor antagonist